MRNPSLASPFPRPADLDRLLGQLLDQQVSCWQEGQRVLVESFLERYPSLRSSTDAVLDLLYREIFLREEQGETPRLAEYLVRFPDFEEDLRLLFEVENALQNFSGLPSDAGAPPAPALPSPGRDEPVVQHTAAGTTVDHPPPTPKPGEPRATIVGLLPHPSSSPVTLTIPGYEMLGELGRGGMGVVYKARQVGLNRLVALKMIRAGGAARTDELERFGKEAEAVARLQHPNIVQIHEIGTYEGMPYFSLELVEGGTLAQKLAGQPLPPLAAARLVQTLAGAVQAAHEKGIIHRDLKPANVLLAVGQAFQPDGGTGVRLESLTYVPKITDFGLAKRLDVEAGQTQTGAIMGTPSYMAPEQARGRIRDLGPACDIYALGAILYELLTGRPPFRGATLLDTLEQVVNREPVAPRSLQPTVPRDLETICLKCLSKEPARRYPSAAALADDLHRFLTGQPIQARTVGLVERTRKWARRKPTAAALVLVSTVAVLVLLLGGWFSFARVSQALQASERSFDRALRAVELFLAQVGEIDLAEVPQMEQKRKEMLANAKAFCLDFLSERKNDPGVQQYSGRIYSRLGDIQGMLEEDRDAEDSYGKAIALFHGLVAKIPKEQEPRRELARAFNNRGILLKRQNRAADAEQSLNDALKLRKELAEAFPQELDSTRDLAETHYFLGALLAPLRGRQEEANDHYRRALELQKQLATDDNRPVYRRDLERSRNNRGKLLWQMGRPKESQEEHLKAVEGFRRLVDKSPLVEYQLYLALSLINLAVTLEQTEPGKAERTFGEARQILAALASNFPIVPRYQQELASVCTNLWRLLRKHKPSQMADAEAVLRQALAIRARLARDFPGNFDNLYKWAQANFELGLLLNDKQPQEAEQAYRDSLAALNNLANNFKDRMDYRRTWIFVLDSLAKLLRRWGDPNDPVQVARLVGMPVAGNVLNALGVLAQAHVTHSALQDAKGCLEQAIQHQQTVISLQPAGTPSSPARPQTPSPRKSWSGYPVGSEIPTCGWECMTGLLRRLRESRKSTSVSRTTISWSHKSWPEYPTRERTTSAGWPWRT